MKTHSYNLQIESFPPYPKKLWESILVSCLRLLERHKNFSFEKCTLNLLVVKDNDMIFYNNEQMGVYGPTNVLSFPEEESDSPFFGKARQDIKKTRTQLGTLILSIDTLLREAFLYGQNPHTHAIRLIAHGLAHLLGYDHDEEMWELTDFLEEQLTDKHISYTTTPLWSLQHG